MSARPTALADLVPADKIGDAVDATLVRFCDLLRSAPDGSIPVPGLTWTVGELGAHLVTGAQLWRRMLAGDPSPISSLSDGSVHTARMIAEFPERDPATLAELIEVESRATADEMSARAPDVPYPWHAGLALTTGQSEAIGLGELLVHGFDLARALGRPWDIPSDYACFVIYGAGAVLPAAVDHAAAQGFTASFDLRLRGGIPLSDAVHEWIAHGRARWHVSRSIAASQPIRRPSYSSPTDVRLLGASSLAGRLIAWGRHPWLAARLATMLQGF